MLIYLKITSARSQYELYPFFNHIRADQDVKIRKIMMNFSSTPTHDVYYIKFDRGLSMNVVSTDTDFIDKLPIFIPSTTNTITEESIQVDMDHSGTNIWEISVYDANNALISETFNLHIILEVK